MQNYIICLLLFFPATLSDHEAGLWHKPCHELNSGRATRSKMPLLSLAKRKVLCNHFLFINDQCQRLSSTCHELNTGRATRSKMPTCATPLLSQSLAKRTVLCDNCLFTNDHKILLQEPQVEGWPSQEILTCPSQRGRSCATIVFLQTIIRSKEHPPRVTNREAGQATRSELAQLPVAAHHHHLTSYSRHHLDSTSSTPPPSFLF